MSSLSRSLSVALCFGALAAAAIAQDPSPLDLPVEPPSRAPVRPVPPLDPDEDEDLIRQVIYVIDCSASMGTVAEPHRDRSEQRARSRLDRAKAEVIGKIESLEPKVAFNVVTYANGTNRWVSPPYRMAFATARNRRLAIEWVKRRELRGRARATAEGVTLALDLLLRDLTEGVVQLYSDGLPTAPTDDRGWHREQIRASSLPFSVDVFGIDARGEFREFGRAVARENRGRLREVP